jgi:tight adherence protein C
MTLTPAAAGGLAAASVAVGLLSLPLLLAPGPVERLSERSGDAIVGPRQTIGRRVVDAIAARLGPRLTTWLRPRHRESLSRRLELAGYPSGLTLQRFVGLKAALALLFGGALLLLAASGGSLLLAIVGGLLAWFAPDVWVVRAGRLRQERIERDLPDFLDILAVTVRAGLGYRAALLRVAQSLGGPLGDEVLVVLRQMELGASRRNAFLAMRDRNDSESLRSFVAAQLQAEELGVPLSEALNDIAADMRRAAHQAARKRAQRAEPRVSLVIISLILPGTVIVILAGIVIASGLVGGGGLGG